MDPAPTPGARFRAGVRAETPLQVVGAINAYSARLAERSSFRAMSADALRVYRTLPAEGTQQSLVPAVQTRDELYQHPGYHAYERKLDQLFARERGE